MISHVYHLQYGVPADELIKLDNLHKLNPAIPTLFFSRDTKLPTFKLGGGEVPLPYDRKMLFVIRDPRDVAVSFYFHIKNRAGYRELDRKGITEADRSLELYDFAIDEKLGVPRVIDHMNRWYEEMQGMPHRLVVKYEEMQAEPVGKNGRCLHGVVRYERSWYGEATTSRLPPEDKNKQSVWNGEGRYGTGSNFRDPAHRTETGIVGMPSPPIPPFPPG